jgi:hypothetical protein
MRSQETVSHLEQQIEGEWGAIRITSWLCFLTCYPWIWQRFKCWKLESKWAAVCFSFRLCSDHMQQLSLHRRAIPCRCGTVCVLSAVRRAFTFNGFLAEGLADWLTDWLTERVCKWRSIHTHTHTHTHTHALSLSLSLSLPSHCLPSECHDARVDVIQYIPITAVEFPCAHLPNTTHIHSCIMCRCLCRNSPVPDNK